MLRKQVNLGVDIGGTFTDVVLEVGSAQYSAKILTTYKAPEDAIIDGMLKVCAQADLAPSSIGRIIHGTTLATNALIERRGAKTALVTTKGFRDVIEMRTESRFEQYDLNLQLPEPLLARNHRYVVEERVGAQGQILKPLNRADAGQLAERIAAAGYDSVAIGFIHSYVDDTHEKLMRDILAAHRPDLEISISSEVSPQMREYERFNTAIANAYVKPLMKSYLTRLAGRLSAQGVVCPIFLMHSGGGIISLETASEFPVRLVESGPAGGAIFAAHIASSYGLDKVLSFDMGGTTAKICLIKNHTPKTSRVFEVARSYRFKKGSGMPISVPVIDMVEIGAGGGSVAQVDAMGRIKVGPESAGSEPGPACYGRAGTKPTVTDADLILGRLDPENFAGGSIKLNAQNAVNAVKDDLATQLNLDIQTAAFAVSEIVDENMANAARVHAVENGEDLSTYTMIAFGGAAPLHAARLCEKLGIGRYLVPPGAGVGSAIGFLRAPFSFEATRSAYMRISDFDPPRVKSLLKELQAEANGFVRSCNADAPASSGFKVYMRYKGQGWEIPVEVPEQLAAHPDALAFVRLFEATYETLFGRIVQGMEIEIASWAVSVSTVLPKTGTIDPVARLSDPVRSGERPIFDPVQARPVAAALYDRNKLKDGDGMTGPASIMETDTTIIVPSGAAAIRQPDGCLDILVGRPESTAVTNLPRSAVSNQVMWNRLISVVEEQAQALIRVAFSTSVREAGDLSAGVYDVEGQMLAQAVTGTPGHVNAMADAVAHFIKEVGTQNIFEGDVYITNDPWKGTGHLHDITIVSPCFHNGLHIGFFGCTAHVVDIGGRGFGADASSIYEEGLCIPIMKFAERGKVDESFVNLVRANVREPDQVTGDIYALAACNEIGQRRLIDMLDEFGMSGLEAIADFILENSCRATLERIAALPRVSAEGEMTIDGYSAPITLKIRLDVGSDFIAADYKGTSGIDKMGVNVPLVYTKAYTCYALKCAIAPDIPNNAGSLAPFKVSAPEGAIVNALRPAAVALRHIIGHMLPDTVYNALDKILPETVPSEGAGALCNFQLSLRPRMDGPAQKAVRAEVLSFNSGGSGARPSSDGLSATAFPSGVMTMPIEATEHAGPVIIWRKELRPDSGGAGKFRGGLGQHMEIGATDEHEFDFSAMFDRVDYPARGRKGGRDGAATRIEMDDGTVMKGKGKQFVPHGRRVVLSLPGGGGYGDPVERHRKTVLRDMAYGYISAEAATRDYGLTDGEIEALMRALGRGEDIV
jgi:N-methylhydantoinase A/oxoprolinase/acetone carboxylase beta subunit/N-methylhydantoinase B/oxoprolinase/acetone carboxylase alpha subunit